VGAHVSAKYRHVFVRLGEAFEAGPDDLLVTAGATIAFGR